MTGAPIVALGQDRRSRGKKAHVPARVADPSPSGWEETLLDAMASAVSLLEATARIQKETAEVLCALAKQNGNKGAVRRLKLAEATFQALTSPPDSPIDQLGRLQLPTSRRQAHRHIEPLTEREKIVLRFLHGTLSLREIGQELHVSQNTIKSHTQAIYRKLGVSTRYDAIQRCRELGLLHA
jgi:ATP/maltotriose-dependent transcriptional regulator MalT